MNPTAARARDLALKRHRREVRFWKMSAWALLGVLAAIVLMDSIRKAPPQVWRTDLAPVGEPYWVVTKGYIRKHDRQWCSFDSGEPISVQHWLNHE